MNDAPAISQGENPLGYAPIISLIRKFALPSIISMLVTAVYNITDQIFIGHVVGMLGNAATNVSFPMVTCTAALSQLVGIGAASGFNLSMGRRNEEDARAFVGTGLFLAVVLGLGLGTVVVLLRTPILLLCGATETVLPYAQPYLGITAYGLPFLLFTTAGSMLIRADGSPSYSMFCMVSGAVVNVVLDWMFMFVFHWGIQGAAAATVAGQVLSCLLCLRYFTRFRAFPIRRSMLRPHKGYVGRLTRLGIPNFLNQSMMMIVNITLNNALAHYGAATVYGSDIPLAVSGVVAKLNSILIACTAGLGSGCQPIFSFNMGAGKYSRLREAYRQGLKVVMCVNLTAFFVFQCFPRQITAIFGTGSELYYQFAEQYLRIYMMMTCIMGIQPLTVNYFTSTGHVKQGTIITLSRQAFTRLPMLLILPPFLGLDGVLIAGPAADFLAVALSLWMVRRSFRRLPKTDREPLGAASG